MYVCKLYKVLYDRFYFIYVYVYIHIGINTLSDHFAIKIKHITWCKECSDVRKNQ